ncbi:MAG: hypothetical protein J7L38_06785 [Thermoproteales archaeon]|nr:hypothetical protein [Thermoproteales archaeon]
MGLIPSFFLFEDRGYDLKDFKKPYVTTIGKVLGEKEYFFVKATIPQEHLDEYVGIFGAEPELGEIGLIEYYWEPCSPLTIHRRNHLDVDLKNFIEVFEKEASKPQIFTITQRLPVDEIDLYIIKEKMKNPFKSLTSMGKIINRSQQLISYHFHKHVYPLWERNSIMIFQNYYRTPLSLHFLEFSDTKSARGFAKTLAYLPYTHIVLLSTSRPFLIYIGTILQERALDLMRIISQLRKKDYIRYYRFIGYVDPDYFKEYTISFRGVLRAGVWSLPATKSLDDVAEELSFPLV